MNKLRFFIILGISLLIVGCPARSLYPLFAKKDLLFNPSLLGTWVDEKEKDTYTFQPSEDNKAYNVIVHEFKDDSSQKGTEGRGDTAIYKVHLGQIGQFWFLDSYPGRKTPDHHLISAHIISRIWFGGDTLRIAPLENDWLKKMIDTNRLKIAHVRLKGDIILKASTQELQKFVLQYAEDDKAFPNPGKLVRVK